MSSIYAGLADLRKAQRLTRLRKLGNQTNCLICNRSFSKVTPCWDHCHTSGKFRGWICRSCNAGLGQFQDSPERLRKAAAYLEHAAEAGRP